MADATRLMSSSFSGSESSMTSRAAVVAFIFGLVFAFASFVGLVSVAFSCFASLRCFELAPPFAAPTLDFAVTTTVSLAVDGTGASSFTTALRTRTVALC